MAVNLLLSYAFHADTRLDQIRQRLVCGRLMIDSGAFTAHTRGRTIALGAYAAYLERWRDCWDHAVTLDVFGDAAATARNTRLLHARGLPVLPVFTRDGQLAEFDAMVRDVGYVCVGGLVGLPKAVQRKRVAVLQRRAADQGGGIHALGVGAIDILRAARPYSADASVISGAFRFGHVVYFNGRTIRDIHLYRTDVLRREQAVIRAHGIDLAQLVRTGRMPGQKDGRKPLMQAMSLAYACADEWLKRTVPVPAPPGGHPPGLHLYNSVGVENVATTAELDQRLHAGPNLYMAVVKGGTRAGGGSIFAEDTAELDLQLHPADDTPVPPIWRLHGRSHTCHRKVPTSHAPAP